MLGSYSFASRALVATPHLPRAFKTTTPGEFGWSAWSYSRQSKLNAWAWHGLGGTRMNAWAVLGSNVYVRKESDSLVHVMQKDVFLGNTDTSTDSVSVEATTQWLDFGKPGKKKALDGLDFDGQFVDAIEIYVSEDGGRNGVLAATIPVGDNDGGWTYNGEMIPLEEVGSATEFKLRFICDGNEEAQVNRLTLYWSDVAG